MSSVRHKIEPAPFRLRDMFPRRHHDASLPPGQRAISTFPRYGAINPDPAAPASVSIAITGDSITPFELDEAALRVLPRTEMVADFHCVAGWTARDIHWSGIRFRDVFDVIAEREPEVAAEITHIRAVGWDGWRAVLLLDDALRDDVLLADRLGDAPLPLEHGGPWRIVSASQYGYKSVKHLKRIEVHTTEPSALYGNALNRFLFSTLLAMHPRARVAFEERHRSWPIRPVRAVYHRLHPVTYLMGAIGARRMRRRDGS